PGRGAPHTGGRADGRSSRDAHPRDGRRSRRRAGRRRGSARRARGAPCAPRRRRAACDRPSRGRSALALSPGARRGDGGAPPGDRGVTTHALPVRPVRGERVVVQPALDELFLATMLLVTFAKIHCSLPAGLPVGDVLTAAFLVVFIWDRLERGDTGLTRSSIVALGFFAAFLLVSLIGYFNLDTQQALTQYGKGMVKFVLHLGFLVAGATLLARRPQRFYWSELAA